MYLVVFYYVSMWNKGSKQNDFTTPRINIVPQYLYRSSLGERLYCYIEVIVHCKICKNRWLYINFYFHPFTERNLPPS